MTKGRGDLVDQLSFYGAYHNNKWNQLIHVIFVPLIWWASVILLLQGIEYYTKSYDIALYSVTSVYLFYALYYVYLGDYVVALSYDVILTMMFFHAKSFYDTVDSAWKIALVCKIIGWYAQIDIGHNRCEGRKAALFDSFFDALIMAPLFTWYEVLFFLGFKKDIKKQLDVAVAEKIMDINRKKKNQSK